MFLKQKLRYSVPTLGLGRGNPKTPKSVWNISFRHPRWLPGGHLDFFKIVQKVYRYFFFKIAAVFDLRGKKKTLLMLNNFLLGVCTPDFKEIQLSMPVGSEKKGIFFKIQDGRQTIWSGMLIFKSIRPMPVGTHV